MCISYPAKITCIKGNVVGLNAGGSDVQALVADEKVQVGDWVLVHGGVVLHRLSEEEALETIAMLGRLFDRGPDAEK
ncbi:MAG TPA: HypC/HybG/HupF family hydrogenase formation chaperone [Candidatus Obscuribacterales bacterium]